MRNKTHFIESTTYKYISCTPYENRVNYVSIIIFFLILEINISKLRENYFAVSSFVSGLKNFRIVAKRAFAVGGSCRRSCSTVAYSCSR